MARQAICLGLQLYNSCSYHVKGADALIPMPLEALAVLALGCTCEYGWHVRFIAFDMQFGGTVAFLHFFFLDFMAFILAIIGIENVLAGFPLVDSIVLFLLYP